jgi:hypothetical protein
MASGFDWLVSERHSGRGASLLLPSSAGFSAIFVDKRWGGQNRPSVEPIQDIDWNAGIPGVYVSNVLSENKKAASYRVRAAGMVATAHRSDGTHSAGDDRRLFAGRRHPGTTTWRSGTTPASKPGQIR